MLGKKTSRDSRQPSFLTITGGKRRLALLAGFGLVWRDPRLLPTAQALQVTFVLFDL